MSCSVTIMAHPARVDHVAGMVARLAGQTAERGWPDPAVVWAHRGKGPWPTAARAWRATGAAHRLILQDDVTFPDDLLARVEALIARWPDAAVSLFHPIARDVERARSAGLDHVPLEVFPRAPGLILPAAVADAAPDWIAAHDHEYPLWGVHDGLRLGCFCRHNGVEMIASLPSIVEHLGDTDAMPSLIGYDGPPRRAVALWSD